MDDKVIVTHREALKTKYGAKGFAKVTAALKQLVAADKKRGVNTRIVYLDDAAAMKKLHAKRFVDPTDYKAAKIAIDGVFKKLKPDYLMILGATDVIPHQDLNNPAYDPTPDGDDDVQAWGDLPYACATPYSRDPAQFVGPTRVVGRLPDLTGASEPSHLLALLKTATAWKCRDASYYLKHFGLSTYSWRKSTTLSLESLFGPNAKLLIAPPKGPRYPNGELAAHMHFINCHGGPAAPEFYGEKGRSQPVSLNTRATQRRITAGTVASVECCYGAELYDSVTLGLDIPICQSYLRQGAYGYLGSTNSAYGPVDTTGLADLLCAYFLRNVLEGASVGRATLMARQQFVQGSGQMDPVDLKTLAQFCVYGDPSVHPVATAPSPAPKGVDKEARDRFRRGERREKLRETGEFLKETKPTASRKQRGARMPAQARTALANIASKGGLRRSQSFTAFKVKGARTEQKGSTKVATAPSRYYLAIGRPTRNGYRVVVIAKEVNGRVIDYRIYHER